MAEMTRKREAYIAQICENQEILERKMAEELRRKEAEMRELQR